MNISMKRLREQAKKLSPSDALSEWTVPVLPSDLKKLFKSLDNAEQHIRAMRGPQR